MFQDLIFNLNNLNKHVFELFSFRTFSAFVRAELP